MLRQKCSKDRQRYVTQCTRGRKIDLITRPPVEQPIRAVGKRTASTVPAFLLIANGARPRSTQACAIGYFAKTSSARLSALSIAASGAIPFFITSNSATLKTCSASTCAMAGL